MFRPILTAMLLFPACLWAQINAAANLEIPNPPLRTPSGFNGLLLMNDTEFLTPQGILDTLPQQAYAPDDTMYEDIEPAAGEPAGVAGESAPMQEQPAP